MADLREKVREELKKYWKEGEFNAYSDKYQYYVSDVNENLFGKGMLEVHRRMFEEGSGSELEDIPAKAKAIDSSSMLSYNFFRNINENCSVEIDGIEYNKVLFEVKLRTLKVRSSPANMDVVLVSRDENTVLFIESKFLEYLENGSADFSDSYIKQDSYYTDENDEWSDLLEMSNKFQNKRDRYNYGIKQNICHLIGISNLRQSKKAREWFKNTYNKLLEEYGAILKAKSYRFLNILFVPKQEDAYDCCTKYMKDLENSFIPEKIRKNYIGKTYIMTYRELYNKLSNTLSNDIRNYLNNRYIKYHHE
jgi:hypothetical protein